MQLIRLSWRHFAVIAAVGIALAAVVGILPRARFAGPLCAFSDSAIPRFTDSRFPVHGFDDQGFTIRD